MPSSAGGRARPARRRRSAARSARPASAATGTRVIEVVVEAAALAPARAPIARSGCPTSAMLRSSIRSGVSLRRDVVVLDLLAQQREPPRRERQALVGAHDPDQVPHHAAHRVPVVVEHDRLERRPRAARAPRLGARRARRAAEPRARTSAAAWWAPTSASSSELLASRLAPWSPVHATSPSASSPCDRCARRASRARRRTCSARPARPGSARA